MRWIREPALDFAVIGLGLFLLHARVARPADDRIVLSPAFVEGLRQEHARRTGKPPTVDEERGLVDRFVDDEVLYREALALGLDRGDSIVRRRLVQKMEFALRGAAREPTAEELAAFVEARRQRYAEPDAVSFRHVFLSRERRGEGAAADAGRALADLQGGADPAALGDPFLQGAAFTRRTGPDVAAIFGGAFAEAVSTLPAGTWSGPIRSSYGEHLVRVEDRAPARARELSPAMRARAREDWLAERREEDDRAALLRLRARYRIEVPR